MKLRNSILLMVAIAGLRASANPGLGLNWVAATAPVTNWTSLASSADGSNLVASVDEGGIYFSTNSGAAWQPSDAPVEYWSGIACSADGTIVAAVTGDGQAFRSWDSGRTWVAGDVPRHYGYFFCVAGSADGGEFAAGSWFEDIFMSTNAGANWFGTGAPNPGWDGIAMSADGRRLVAVCNNMGPIYCSTNSGASWNQTSATNANWNSVTCSADGLTMAAAGIDMGTGIGSIYVSRDGGNTWVRSQAPNEDWTSIAASADGGRMIAGAGGNYQWMQAICISTNFGATWNTAGGPELPWKAVAISADGTGFAAAAQGGGIYVSHAPPVTAWELKTEALNEMMTVYKSLRHNRLLLGPAITSVRASLANKLWIDQSHLAANQSGKVFTAEETAAVDLDSLAGGMKNPVPANVMASWESLLAEADRSLAGTERDAAANTISASQLAKVQQALDQGDQAAMAQQYAAAIDDYALAYQLATP